ncbi:MAG: carbonic anhydrase [bacterium]
MKKFFTIVFIISMFCLNANANNIQSLNADKALQKLKQGNVHFVKMHFKHPDVSLERLHVLETGQHPFAVILSCSDSRVPPEIIFDQGLGDIFEVRNAGNVLDEHVIGSVEYALVHLGVKLVVVMGHQDCGAIKATINSFCADSHAEQESKYIKSLTDSIGPSVSLAKTQSGNLLDNAVKNNVRASVKGLVDSDPIISDYTQNKGAKVVPAIYNMHTGVVEFFKY